MKYTQKWDAKLAELNAWEEHPGGDFYPSHGYEVYVQRMSAYIQRNMEQVQLNPHLKRPDSDSVNGNSESKLPVDSLDNSKS
jgi:hypothetical protein